MKWVPLEGISQSAKNSGALSAEYRAGRDVGVITLGAEHFFFRRFLTAYYIPYSRVTRYFRRIVAVPAKLGCCGGELRIENLVICGADGQGGERELAQIQLPGERAALSVMEDMRRLAPEAACGKPTAQSGSGDKGDKGDKKGNAEMNAGEAGAP